MDEVTRKEPPWWAVWVLLGTILLTSLVAGWLAAFLPDPPKRDWWKDWSQTHCTLMFAPNEQQGVYRCDDRRTYLVIGR